MAKSIETKPHSPPSFFEGVKGFVASQIEEVNSATTKAGKAIRKEIGDKVSLIKEGVIPTTIDVADITHHDGTSPLTLFIVRYNPEKNELSLISKEAGDYEDFSGDPFRTFPTPEEGAPRYVPLTKALQLEKVLEIMSDGEWVEYGPKIVDALEKALKKAEQNKAKSKK